MINIYTDSTADLGIELSSKYRVNVVPLLVHIAEQEYQDGVDLDAPRLFELVAKAGQLPKTAARSVGDYKQYFQTPGENIYIGISSQLSASIQNASLAADELSDGRVCIIDSLNLSTGIGLLVLRAAQLRDQGYSVAQIKEDILSCIPRVRTSFVLETMEYLYKGGRCSALQAVVGSLLRIRPVIEVKPDGCMGVKDKLRGTRAKALESMLASFEADLPNLDRQRVFVTHANCRKDAEFLASEIRRIAAPEEVLITMAGSVISSHCGPDTIGILYLVK